MIPINYHHLYYFWVVAEEGSVTRVARKLRISQPSLSAQIKQLEASFEMALFERVGKRLVLTEKGNFVLSYAQTIFVLGQELSDSIADGIPRGEFRIQIGVSSIIPTSMVSALLQFIYKHPSKPYVELVEKNMEEMIQDLSVHKLDLILGDLPVQSSMESGIQNNLIAKAPIVLCASPALARTIKKVPEDLNKIPMILPTEQTQTYNAMQEYFTKHKISPPIIGKIQDLELVKQLVIKGIATAPLNEFSVEKIISRKKLAIVDRSSNYDIYDTIYLTHKKRKIAHPLIQHILRNFHLE